MWFLDDVVFCLEFWLDVFGMDVFFMLVFEVQFDFYVLIENCSGYLKVVLDVGIELFYFVFCIVFNIDEWKELMVLVIFGIFWLLVDVVFQVKDVNIICLLMEFWQFYECYLEYIGQVYYLQFFFGVMIKYMVFVEEVCLIENELGINVNGFFVSRVDMQLGYICQLKVSFQGINWEIIVYVDFDEEYQCQEWYVLLFGLVEISVYFVQLCFIFEWYVDFLLFMEGVEYCYYLCLEGVFVELVCSVWDFSVVVLGVYVL